MRQLYSCLRVVEDHPRSDNDTGSSRVQFHSCWCKWKCSQEGIIRHFQRYLKSWSNASRGVQILVIVWTYAIYSLFLILFLGAFISRNPSHPWNFSLAGPIPLANASNSTKRREERERDYSLVHRRICCWWSASAHWAREQFNGSEQRRIGAERDVGWQQTIRTLWPCCALYICLDHVLITGDKMYNACKYAWFSINPSPLTSGSSSPDAPPLTMAFASSSDCRNTEDTPSRAISPSMSRRNSRALVRNGTCSVCDAPRAVGVDGAVVAFSFCSSHFLRVASKTGLRASIWARFLWTICMIPGGWSHGSPSTCTGIGSSPRMTIRTCRHWAIRWFWRRTAFGTRLVATWITPNRATTWKDIIFRRASEIQMIPQESDHQNFEL